MEQTLIILKPDCVQRGLVGRVVSRFEEKGLAMAAIKMMHLTRELAERQYAVHKGKPFYPGLIEYITSGPVVVMVLRGPRAIEVCRALMGKTFGYEAEPGTIRGDLALGRTYNLVHGSDSPETAATEIALYFDRGELLDYTPDVSRWIAKPDET